jgi:Family of unknown function (DUF5317)
MFILYALLAGLLVGLLAGGRIAGLSTLQIRWPVAIVLGLVTQVVLFTDAVAARVGGMGAGIYVASTFLVLAAVLRNGRIRGMPLVAVGAVCNMAAIMANGGYMPAGESAMAVLGKTDPEIYSNSAVMAEPALWFLTDIFAMPAGMPFANIFSFGDILIGVGIAMVIVIAMRRPAGVARARAASEVAPVGGARAH